MHLSPVYGGGNIVPGSSSVYFRDISTFWTFLFYFIFVVVGGGWKAVGI